VGYAQQYKSIDGASLIRKEKERSRVKTVTVLNRDSTVLQEGYYVTEWPDQSRFYFYVDKEGQLDRTARKIFSNDASFLMITMELRNNKLHGKRLVYDNKVLISDTDFKDGYIQKEKVFREKVMIRENFYTSDGKIDSTREYEQGTLEYTYKELGNGANLRRSYFPDGTVQQWKEVDQMRKVMLTREFDPAGRLLTEELVQGKDSVISKRFYPNGLVSTVNAMGIDKGYVREFDEKGKLISEKMLTGADVMVRAPFEMKMASDNKGNTNEQ
jgi:antitoxin component YwqK of YwqJK toxin-antitoxin module